MVWTKDKASVSISSCKGDGRASIITDFQFRLAWSATKWHGPYGRCPWYNSGKYFWTDSEWI